MSNATLIILSLVMLDCGSRGNKIPETPTIDARLVGICQLAEDPAHPEDGDSLFFTGFLRTACGGDMTDYETAPGRYSRWPTSANIKWDDPNSRGDGTVARSENSRDGYLAVMWNAWARQDLATLERIYSFGKKRDWFMGDGRAFGVDTVFNFAMRSTLAEMIYRLGGQNDVLNRFLPVTWGNCRDYECWVQTAHLALRGDVYGRLSSDGIAALDWARKLQPLNPLHELVWQRYSGRLDTRPDRLLLDSPWHPWDRLATDNDYCELWPYRRGPGNVGREKPCPERGLTHSHGDWAFTAWLLKRLNNRLTSQQ